MTKLDNLKQGVVKGYNKVSFQAVKHSPEILLGYLIQVFSQLGILFVLMV